MIRSVFDLPRLYHFTDARNIASIKEQGGLYCKAQLDLLGCGDLIPGGNQWSLDADVRRGMDQFVHLSLRNEHPMQYIAEKEGRIVRTVWLQVDKAVLDLPGVMFCGTVSNQAGAAPVHIRDADPMIDFEVLFGGLDWRDPAIKARLLIAKKYEILVPECVDIAFLRNLPNG